MSERLFRSFAWCALCVFMMIAWAQYDRSQWPSPTTWQALISTSHPCGPFGLFLAHFTVSILGPMLAILFPLALGLFAWSSILSWPKKRLATWTGRLLLVALFASAIAELLTGEGSGGFVGSFGLGLLGKIVGPVGTMILLAAAGAIMLLRLGSPARRPMMAHGGMMRERLYDVGQGSRQKLYRLTRELRDFVFPQVTDDLELEEPEATVSPRTKQDVPRRMDALRALRRSSDPKGKSPRIRNFEKAPEPVVMETHSLPDSERDDEPMIRTQADEDYALPSLDLLDEVIQQQSTAPKNEELLQLSSTVEKKLGDFGIGGRVAEVQPGPVITTYEFEPAPGVKVSQVTSRRDDLAMALRAQAIRMVAPIPGKAAIGIEIPNSSSQVVSLAEIMRSWSDDINVGKLGIAMGKTVSGEPFFVDLTTMPHLLVAGATGSGKSVCINVLLCSLLLKHNPNEVKLLLIDPKMLELTAYHDIPHLLHPVVTDPKEAYKALHWMTLEMERRYRELAKASVRNIQGYNKKIRAGEIRTEEGELKQSLPYVVVIVDELADLMIQVGREIETPIARLAQMARAVGIHLVLATQRPSVDVLTGVIKANFPSRIAFQVSSRIDSRTILDAKGAETLLGRGDMLFTNGGRIEPIRLHGAFVSIEECERISEYWRSFNHKPSKLDLGELKAGGRPGDSRGDDALYEAARRLVVTSGVGSVSYLQRRLKVGYSRAARIMDMLEEAGVVGPAVGSKPREVLESPEDLPEPLD